MKSFVALALAATTLAMPQASSPPSGCQASTSGTFQITTVNVTSSKKRDLAPRQLAGPLTLTLSNGNLKDQAGRTGYIASNYQFQFDNPVQAGALQTTGFSLCSNGSLALSTGSRPAGPAVWYQCLSGNFYNLYSQSTGAQCIPIYIMAVNQGGAATQKTDGQPQVTQAPVSQISDGQPQATTPGRVVSQISDGQPQAPSARPPVVSQISDGQPQAPKPTSRAPVVSQISDGQPQVPKPTAPVVSQISDGQPQVPKPTVPVVSQISDGQPQVPKATSAPVVVSQISDGQPQVPKATSAPVVVSQISDGQPQVPKATSTPVVVSQISDGQPQVPKATNGTVASTTSSAPAQFTGAAATGQAAAGAVVAGVFGVFALL